MSRFMRVGDDDPAWHTAGWMRRSEARWFLATGAKVGGRTEELGGGAVLAGRRLLTC